MKSYVIPCSSEFRDAVRQLADRRGLSATDLALSVLALVDPKMIAAVNDPGEPPSGDRESVRLKSGPRKGRALTRKPRLQLRLPGALDHATVRRALALAIDLDAGQRMIQVVSPADQTHHESELEDHRRARMKAEQELADMRSAVNVIAFDIDGQSISSIAQAKYVLGLPPDVPLSHEDVKSRFRQLSRVFHPDLPTGDTMRMSRIIEAVRFLEARLPRPFEFKPVAR